MKNILSGHLPPALINPVIFIPSVSVDILASVRELLLSGVVNIDITRLDELRNTLCMIGIIIQTYVGVEKSKINEDLISETVTMNTDKHENIIHPIRIKTEKYEIEEHFNIKSEKQEYFEDFGIIKSEQCAQQGEKDCEDTKLNIVIKLEKDSKDQDIKLTAGCSQFDPKLEEIRDLIKNEKIIKTEISVEKQQRGMPKINSSGDVEEQSKVNKKLAKKPSKAKHIFLDKLSKNMKSEFVMCPEMVKNLIQCEECVKTFSTQNQLEMHIRRSHMKLKRTCKQCGDKFLDLKLHIKQYCPVFHNK